MTWAPLVSVVIPAYKQAQFVAEAIKSATEQTYRHLEVFVIDDASPDNTTEIAQKFSDERVQVIRHERNLGLSAARNTGIRESSGELIAFLDADDYFDDRKVEEHVRLMAERPDVGVTYNARYDLDHSSTSVRELWRPAMKCDLRDLVGGFPFAPSDMVVRREWIDRVGLFDEELLEYSEDLDINCRLALAGCRFAGIDRPLNYRRYHSARSLRVGPRSVAAVEVLERIFRDRSCPEAVKKIQDKAIASHCLIWSFHALAQDESSLGRELARTALKLNPDAAAGNPSAMVRLCLQQSTVDEHQDHVELIDRMVSQFPQEVDALRDAETWLKHNGYLWRGFRNAMWGRENRARELFSRAKVEGATCDPFVAEQVAAHLLNMRDLLGQSMVRSALERVTTLGRKVDPAGVARIRACYFANDGFHRYKTGEYRQALGSSLNALANQPSFIANRGVVAVAGRSLLRMLIRHEAVV